jgi:type I restriction enzyme, S subunit
VKVDWVSLGEVLRIVRDPVELQVGETYQRVGIYSWGKGMLRREPATVAEMGSMKYFTFPIPSLVFSNIQAWEGAVALADDKDEGRVCSSRFYPYVPRPGARVNLRYMLEFFRSDVGLALMRQASPGTQVRNKVLSRTALESSSIPLPSLPDQDRIAKHLSELGDRVTISGARPEASVNPAISAWLDALPTRRMEELAEVGPRPLRVAADTPVDFVPMDSVDAVTGMIVTPIARTRGDVSSGYRQFVPGDLIFARITPCMQNGKSAIYSGVNGEIGYGSTEFHVIRPRDPMYTEWIWAVLRTDWFISRAKAAFTGTAGQQRVPASFLEQAEVPTPPADDLRGATDRLLALRARVNALNENTGRRNRLAQAVLPAARNEIFNAMR